MLTSAGSVHEVFVWSWSAGAVLGVDGGPAVTHYRFLDGMGDVVADGDFEDHAAALRWARADDGPDEDVQRVEYLGPDGDWRWAGALEG